MIYFVLKIEFKGNTDTSRKLMEGVCIYTTYRHCSMQGVVKHICDSFLASVLFTIFLLLSTMFLYQSMSSKKIMKLILPLVLKRDFRSKSEYFLTQIWAQINFMSVLTSILFYVEKSKTYNKSYLWSNYLKLYV